VETDPQVSGLLKRAQGTPVTSARRGARARNSQGKRSTSGSHQHTSIVHSANQSPGTRGFALWLVVRMSHGCSPGHCRHSSPCSSPAARRWARHQTPLSPTPRHCRARSRPVPARGRAARKPLREDTESLSLPSPTQGCFSKAALPARRGALAAVPKAALTTRSTATTSIPTPSPCPRARRSQEKGRSASGCHRSQGLEASHTCPQRGFRSQKLGTDCRHGLGLQGHAVQREFMVFHRSRPGGHLPGGCRSILSGRPAEAAAKGPGHFRTMTQGARMTWQTGSQE